MPIFHTKIYYTMEYYINGYCHLEGVKKSANDMHWLFANFFQVSSGPRELSRELFPTGGKRKLAIFEVFRAYIMELL